MTDTQGELGKNGWCPRFWEEFVVGHRVMEILILRTSAWCANPELDILACFSLELFLLCVEVW